VSIPKITPLNNKSNGFRMWLILLEALGAGLILIVLVWWTMFSGRKDWDNEDDDTPPPRT